MFVRIRDDLFCPICGREIEEHEGMCEGIEPIADYHGIWFVCPVHGEFYEDELEAKDDISEKDNI